MKTICFDTETNGLIQNSGKPLNTQPRIIEFSAVMIEDDGTVLEALDFLCNPGIPITSEITRITGIKNDDLVGKQPFSYHSQAVMDFFSRADAVVAHNLYYDKSLIDFEMSRLKATVIFPWPKIKICTVESTEWILGFRMSLTALHEHLFGVGFSGAHRAAEDVKALEKCFVELRKQGVC